jgi:fructose-bisphosphate aldolase class I
VEPEILLDGEHGIERTFEVAQKVWAEVFYYLAENNVMFEGILLKPSMVTPGAECKDRATPDQVAEYTLKLLHRRIPPAVPGIMASSLSTFTVLPYFFREVLNSFPSQN